MEPRLHGARSALQIYGMQPQDSAAEDHCGAARQQLWQCAAMELLRVVARRARWQRHTKLRAAVPLSKS